MVIIGNPPAIPHNKCTLSRIKKISKVYGYAYVESWIEIFLKNQSYSCIKSPNLLYHN